MPVSSISLAADVEWEEAFLSAPPSFPSEIMPSSFGQHSSNSGLQAALSARQQQLQMQQIELENRQRELEMQRQQLISGLQDPTLQQTLAGIPTRQPSIMGSMGGGGFDPSRFMANHLVFAHER